MKTVLASALLLAGCAGSIADNRQRPVRASYVSDRSVAALDHCLAGSLDWAGTPSVISGDKETEVAFTSPYGTEPLITLRPTGNRTIVDVRLKHGYIAKMRREIEGCVAG